MKEKFREDVPHNTIFQEKIPHNTLPYKTP